MSDSAEPARHGEGGRSRVLRGAIDVGIAAQVLLYLYLYVLIFRHSNPKGDGMEWVAVMPASIILALGVAPPLVLRKERRWLWLGLLLAIAGLMLAIAFLFEVAHEFGDFGR